MSALLVDPLDRLLVVRRLRSSPALGEFGTSLWTGNAPCLQFEQELPFTTFRYTTPDFEMPLARFGEALDKVDGIETVRRTREPDGAQIRWQGGVLLGWESALAGVGDPIVGDKAPGLPCRFSVPPTAPPV